MSDTLKWWAWDMNPPQDTEYNDYPPELAANNAVIELEYVLEHAVLTPDERQMLTKAMCMLQGIANEN